LFSASTRFIEEFAMRSLPFLLLSTLAWVGPSAAAAEGIPEKTLKELKAATVYIKVEFRDAVGPLLVTGSGFLVHADGQTGYVVTNDHVVSPQPGQIRVVNPKLVFRSGTPAESTVDAVVVASDPVRDLAVLKVSGRKDLPRSLTVDVQTRIGETMPVYCLGFPFGGKLAVGKGNPAINITRGTISSLRSDDKGQVMLVQIDAEVNPGNSGGPVVDDKGALVGIAAAKFVDARTVGFAVPLKPLAEIMQGKVARVNFETVGLDKGQALVKVEASLLDPLGKLKDVAVYYGPARDFASLPKADKDGRTPQLKGANRVPLKIDAAKGLGTFSLVRPNGDQLAIAAQVAFTNGAGQNIVSPAEITNIFIPKAVFEGTLTSRDAIDPVRGLPSKRYTHKVQAGKHYVIEMRGDPSEIDPWLILRDGAGNILAQDDDSGGYPNAMIVCSPAKDDDYQISATAFAKEKLGPFLLRIREETGLTVGPQGISKAGVLRAADSRDPFMHTPAHTFNLILGKGRPCTVQMDSKDFDPYLRLENMAGVNLRNEDIGGNGRSTLQFIPLQDGIYRVVATCLDFKTGSFDLKLTQGAALPGFWVPFDDKGRTKFGPVGGNGGTAFDDKELPEGTRITGVKIRHGAWIDSVELLYKTADGKTESLGQHGGQGGTEKTFLLDEGEHIQTICARGANVVESLKIITNKRQSIVFGNETTNKELRMEVQRHEVVGFYGRAGLYLDQLGIIVRKTK
jgi:S1-C subfamily serine protease